MNKFWTLAFILDFFFVLSLVVIEYYLNWTPWQFALAFAAGNFVITMIASLFEEEEKWLVCLILMIPNYFVMLTYLVGIVDVLFVFGIINFGLPHISQVWWLPVFNLLVIAVWWQLIPRIKKAEKPEVIDDDEVLDKLE